MCGGRGAASAPNPRGAKLLGRGTLANVGNSSEVLLVSCEALFSGGISEPHEFSIDTNNAHAAIREIKRKTLECIFSPWKDILPISKPIYLLKVCLLICSLSSASI